MLNVFRIALLYLFRRRDALSSYHANRCYGLFVICKYKHTNEL